MLQKWFRLSIIPLVVSSYEVKLLFTYALIKFDVLTAPFFKVNGTLSKTSWFALSLCICTYKSLVRCACSYSDHFFQSAVYFSMLVSGRQRSDGQVIEHLTFLNFSPVCLMKSS